MFPIPELKTVYINNEMYILKWYKRLSNLVPESSFPLTSGRKRKLWEQPFQACALDVDCVVKPDRQNSPLWKRVIAWERSRAASGYGIILGDADRNKQEEFSAECHSVDWF